MIEERILKESDVLNIISVSHSTLYRMIKNGKFPCSIKISSNRIGWLQSDVEKWLKDKKLLNFNI